MNKTTETKCNISGKDIIFQTGKLAKQANGAVFCSMGNSKVLTTAVMSKKESTLDFFPLTVNYNEKYYAAGKIPGGFIKREGKPRDKETIISRLIDRPVRPLFADGFRNEVQIIPTALSVDNINPQDIIAINASSCALTISDIPFDGPIGAVRVGKKEDEFLINPNYSQIEDSEIDLIIAGTEDAIIMVEGGCSNIKENDLMEAIKKAHENIKLVIQAQKELRDKVGLEKREVKLFQPNEDLKQKVTDYAQEKLKKLSDNPDKQKRSEDIEDFKDETIEHFTESVSEEDLPKVSNIFDDIEKQIVREEILKKEKRADGRGPDDIRDIECEVDTLDLVHGSALFTRGQTQALAITTLGSHMDEQLVDDLEGSANKKFMLHYNFPPFSVGECSRIGPPSRREIGHGHLAERALTPMLPQGDDFKYTIRLVSEVLESNGSSSMATVCAGSMSLLAAGTPLRENVSGIAMGLVFDEESGDYKILTDIQGLEDHLGDMDFKVAGTKEGITAFQMDVKIKGISYEIMENALEKAKNARLSILEKMDNVISEPRKEIAASAPRYKKLHVEPDVIKTLIGPSGKTIKSIVEKTGSDLDIDDNGDVNIYAKDQEAMENTVQEVEKYTQKPKVGEIYEGKVKKIMDFGAFVEILPGTDGLCHISEFTQERLGSVRDFTKEGDTLTVKLIDIDRQGRLKLSHKQAIAKFDDE